MAVEFDWSFRVSDILLFGTAGITLIIGYIRMQTSVSAAQDMAKDSVTAAAASKRAGEVSALCVGKIELLSRELAEHRVQVAEKYTARKVIFALEERLLGAVERLTDRVEQLLQRRQ